jgi:hypothetical protein
MPAPICPACNHVVTPSNRGVQPWGAEGPTLHPTCADDVDQSYQLLEALQRDRRCVICRGEIDSASSAEFVNIPSRAVTGPAHRACLSGILRSTFQRACRTGRVVVG